MTHGFPISRFAALPVENGPGVITKEVFSSKDLENLC